VKTKSGVSGNGNAQIFRRVPMPQRLPETTLPSYRWQGFIPAYLPSFPRSSVGMVLLSLQRYGLGRWSVRHCVPTPGAWER